jgi:hypothetical protein
MNVTELLNQNKNLYFISIAALVTFLLVIGGFFFYKLQKAYKRRCRRRRLARGIRAETKGLSLLKSAGYEIETVQESLRAYCFIDGNKVNYTLRPDAIVSKGGKRYIAEIKSGKVAPDPLFKDTRRQLLEYFFCFNTEGVVLVNTEEKKIQNVYFCGQNRINGKKTGTVILAFTLGVIFALFLVIFVN